MSDAPPQHPTFPDALDVVIEVPRMGFIKRKDDGSIDFISPLPCPFNYGSVPNTVSGDGDREDAVVLGPKLPRGTKVRMQVVARVSFIDAGDQDPKWICSPGPLTEEDRRKVIGFFSFYARSKTLLNALRGKAGSTGFVGIEER
jgi:inorganic pyrophosphatase